MYILSLSCMKSITTLITCYRCFRVHIFLLFRLRLIPLYEIIILFFCIFHELKFRYFLQNVRYSCQSKTDLWTYVYEWVWEGNVWYFICKYTNICVYISKYTYTCIYHMVFICLYFMCVSTRTHMYIYTTHIHTTQTYVTNNGQKVINLVLFPVTTISISASYHR